MVAIQKLRDLPDDHDAAAGCLCRSAWYLYCNLARARGRQSNSLARMVNDDRQQSSSAEAERIEMLAAWASLGPHDRHVLALGASGSSLLDELAAALGCGRGAAAMRLSRARVQLGRLIEASPEAVVNGNSTK